MAIKTTIVLKGQFLGTDPEDHNEDMVDSLGRAASTTVAGIARLATSAETITGTDATLAVTPAGLVTLTGTATRSGLLELATDAEAKTGSDTARAITPANLAAVLGGIKLISFAGRNGVGACTATGAVVGDKVIAVASLTAGALGDADAAFEDVVTVVNQIQQSSGSDLSANNYLAFVVPVV